MIEIDELHAIFTFDFERGRVFWKCPPKNHPRLVGSEAGSPRTAQSGKVYWHIKIGRKAYKRGRLIYLAATGRHDFECIDHINGDSEDDRLVNLREATITQNAWNHKGRARRIDLPMGVRRIARSGRYEARISYHKRQMHLGAFDTPEEAHAVYLAKRKELFREFA